MENNEPRIVIVLGGPDRVQFCHTILPQLLTPGRLLFVYSRDSFPANSFAGTVAIESDDNSSKFEEVKDLIDWFIFTSSPPLAAMRDIKADEALQFLNDGPGWVLYDCRSKRLVYDVTRSYVLSPECLQALKKE